MHRNMAFAPPANLVAEAKASNFPTTFVPTPHPPAGPPPPSSVPGPCLPSGPPPGGGPPPPNMSEATHVNLAAIAAAANAAIAASVQDAARKSGFSSGATHCIESQGVDDGLVVQDHHQEGRQEGHSDTCSTQPKGTAAMLRRK